MSNNYEKEFEELFPEMFTTYPYGGIAVGAGWVPMLKLLCTEIQRRVDFSRKEYDRVILVNKMLDEFAAGVDTTFRQMYEHITNEHNLAAIKNNLIKIGHRTPAEPCAPVVVHQVKEKFGTLRFYAEGGDDYTDGMIDLAEAMSGKICEKCGNVGQLRSGGWLRTLCDAHEAEYQANKR